jgi:hypothetical protein
LAAPSKAGGALASSSQVAQTITKSKYNEEPNHGACHCSDKYEIISPIPHSSRVGSGAPQQQFIMQTIASAYAATITVLATTANVTGSDLFDTAFALVCTLK